MKVKDKLLSNNIKEDVVGGKAKRLYELQMSGFPVKKFFVINTEVISLIIQKGFVPKDVLDDIISSLEFNSFGVAVRSSAVGEDGILSWAGQFSTRLFVEKNNLEKAIIECAQAQLSDSVQAYAKTHNVQIPKLAIVVQEMVNAETAGVLFTTNPVNKHLEVVIEAISGVAESLVDGSRVPIRFHVDATTGDLLKVDGDRNDILLSDNQLLEIIQFGEKAVELFGSHQDIEWAIERGTKNIFINQSRAITTVSNFNLDETADFAKSEIRDLISKEFTRLDGLGLDLNDDVLSDQNIAEILTPHPCQMSFGIFTYCFAHGDGAIKIGRNKMGYDIGAELSTGFFNLVGGQPRCSIIHDALTYRIKGIPLHDYAKLIEFYLNEIKQDEKMANYPEIVLYKQNPERKFLESLFGKELGSKYHSMYQKFFSNFSDIEDHLDKYCRDEFIPKWQKSMTFYSNAHLSSDLHTMTKSFKKVADMLRTEACVAFVQAARIGFFVFARLRNLLTKIFGEKGEEFLNIVTSGIPLNLNPNLAFSIRLSQFRDGIISIEDVLSEFGHLGAHELEVSIPRYKEQSEIISELAKKISGNPLEELTEGIEKSNNIINYVLSNAGEYREELEREIDVARRYLPLREVVKFEFLRGYDISRSLLVAINKKLNWSDGLIFHLDPTEIFLLNSGNVASFRELAMRRHKTWKENKALYVPTVIWGSDLDVIGRPSISESSILHGVGVTNFTVEGEVVVITDLNDRDAISILKPGSILVTITTDPAWTPFLSIIGSRGGLITEVGGMLAHAAIYAREAGLAAVLNVQNVTKILKTGMKIRVNGHQGYVEILK